MPLCESRRRYAIGLGALIEQVPALFEHGATWVRRDPVKGFTVVDRCGLAFARFDRLRDAKALARSLGARVDSYFERAAAGDVLAAKAIARLSRIHSRRAK